MITTVSWYDWRERSIQSQQDTVNLLQTCTAVRTYRAARSCDPSSERAEQAPKPGAAAGASFVLHRT